MRQVPTSLTPMLTVRDAAAAIHFYERAFGAKEHERLETPTGQIVAEMSIDGQGFFVVDENPEAFNLSPESLGRNERPHQPDRRGRGRDHSAMRSQQVRPRSFLWPTNRTGCGRAAWPIPTVTIG